MADLELRLALVGRHVPDERRDVDQGRRPHHDHVTVEVKVAAESEEAAQQVGRRVGVSRNERRRSGREAAAPPVDRTALVFACNGWRHLVDARRTRAILPQNISRPPRFN